MPAGRSERACSRRSRTPSRGIPVSSCISRSAVPARDSSQGSACPPLGTVRMSQFPSCLTGTRWRRLNDLLRTVRQLSQAVQQPLNAIGTRMPGLLRQRPAVLPLQRRDQPPHVRQSRLTRLLPVEPVHEPLKQSARFTRPQPDTARSPPMTTPTTELATRHGTHRCSTKDLVPPLVEEAALLPRCLPCGAQPCEPHGAGLAVRFEDRPVRGRRRSIVAIGGAGNIEVRDQVALRIHDGAFSAMDLTARPPRNSEERTLLCRSARCSDPHRPSSAPPCRRGRATWRAASVRRAPSQAIHVCRELPAADGHLTRRTTQGVDGRFGSSRS